MESGGLVLKQMIQTIEQYRMIERGSHVIAGVSGGADSVCLLAALREYRKCVPFDLTVIHVEHGIRGEESLRDAQFVEALCRNWQIPFRAEQADVKALAAETGMTVEEAGRKARYDIFERYCRELGADKIAVAHNRNDQAETVLLNLARGSGIRGLGGILPVRGKIIRPLLFVSREEIEQWLADRKIAYRVDSTNLETDYTRNRLRLQVIPEMERGVNKEAVKHIADCALHLQKAERYLKKRAQELYETCTKQTGCGVEIFLRKFAGEEELMQEYVLRMAVDMLLGGRGLRDYTARHIEDMKRLMEMPCGKRMDFPGGLSAERQKDVLLLTTAQTPETEGGTGKQNTSEGLLLSGDGVYEFMGQAFLAEYRECGENTDTFPEKKYTKWLAYDTIENNVCLRTRRAGDYLVVNREGGRKKLKDYLIDQKIPRRERDRVLLVAQGSHILWVIGERISEAAKITRETKKLLMIQKMEENG